MSCCLQLGILCKPSLASFQAGNSTFIDRKGEGTLWMLEIPVERECEKLQPSFTTLWSNSLKVSILRKRSGASIVKCKEAIESSGTQLLHDCLCCCEVMLLTVCWSLRWRRWKSRSMAPPNWFFVSSRPWRQICDFVKRVGRVACLPQLRGCWIARV